jgi:hypothetical protein
MLSAPHLEGAIIAVLAVKSVRVLRRRPSANGRSARSGPPERGLRDLVNVFEHK